MATFTRLPRYSGNDLTAVRRGDHFVMRLGGTSTADKNDLVQARTCMWSFVSSSGKQKGITGNRIYQGNGAADGSVIIEVVGEYQIAGKRSGIRRATRTALLLHFFVLGHQLPFIKDVALHGIFQVFLIGYFGVTQFYIQCIDVKEIAVLAVRRARSNVAGLPHAVEALGAIALLDS